MRGASDEPSAIAKSLPEVPLDLSRSRPLADLVGRLDAAGQLVSTGAWDGGAAQVSSIAYDSRGVGDGSLFVAIPGEHADGHDFLLQAARAGACAVLVERRVDAAPLRQLVVRDTRLALAIASAWWFGDPSHELGVVGVTGTDGKTTTSFLANAVLEAAGISTGLITTAAVKVGRDLAANPEHVTTPQAPELQRYLRQMVAAGNEAAIVESTSHGLALHRVGEIAYDVAIFTNLTHEHLELHGTFEAYRAAKLSLFSRARRRARGSGRRRPTEAPGETVASGRHRQPRRPLGSALRRRRSGCGCKRRYVRERSAGPGADADVRAENMVEDMRASGST